MSEKYFKIRRMARENMDDQFPELAKHRDSLAFGEAAKLAFFAALFVIFLEFVTGVNLTEGAVSSMTLMAVLIVGFARWAYIA